MKKRIAVFLTCIILFLAIFPAFSLNVSAKSNLDVRVSAGFDNKGKDTRGLPVLLTVTNKGDAFSGDIVIDSQQGYSGGMGIVTPLEIGANETKTIKIMLDYFSTQYSNGISSNKMIHIYDENWKTGKEISFTGDDVIKPQMYERESTFVLTFTNSIDRLSVLSKLATNNSTEIIHLGQIKQDLIPTTASAWSVADIVVVDEYSIASLKEEEQQSLLEWVKLGGTVVIGASDNLDGEIGIFKNDLPLSLNDQTRMISSKDIQKSIKGVKLSNDVTTYAAQKADKEAKTVLEVDQQILAAKRTLGNGQIIQTTFSLGDEPLSMEKDYEPLLQKVIPINAISNMKTDPQYTNFIEGDTYANELFPTFQVSTILLIIIIIIYIVIVGPLLYFILKKKDKREYAWWIIPALSLFISILVFAYGAKDRLSKPQIQQSAVYEIDEDDSLNGYFINSLLTNRSGDFTFALSPNSTATLLRNFDTGGVIHKQGILEQFQNEKRVTIRNNRYWSVSTIAGQLQMQNIGSFNIDLEVEDSVLKGNITNNLPYTVKDVSIWYGSQWLKLGTIKPEQTLKVTQTINGALLLPAMPVTTNYSSQVKNKDDIIKSRQQMLKYSAYDLIANKEQPALVGWVDESITPISLKNSKADMSSINLVVQSFSPKTNLSGEFVLPANSMSADIYSTSNSGYAERDLENSSIWHIEEGTYDFVWTIPDMLQNKKIAWTELQLANTDTKNLLLQIFNVKTSSYEEINDGRFTLTKNIKDYISNDGQVKFKLERKMSDDPSTTIPSLQLKGEVKP
ncbi:DUF7408 domain-containing protein [Rummeliibacillus suwonensis]|uniref:DUF7408 domain-containing protein n=1 Tax=Rummeliibacillus suwonensis TaxID=1306154 RepID=UPI001AAF28D3|nr:hypothetical protein [Rummeliibacillus suwonensis]MBO2534393.1 hypothetical protein [Rummeliibacillus suwonensis]